MLIQSARTLLIILAAAQAIAAITIYFCFPAGLIKWSALAGLCLYAACEYRRLIRQGNIRLRVNPARSGIEIEMPGQPYFFCKYKVYQSRWFAILKLMDRHNNRSLVLMPDSFESLSGYRRLRHQLNRLERIDAA